MMPDLLTLPARKERENSLTYEQLRIYMNQLYGWKPSKRWLQLRKAEGLPHFVDARGKVRFFPSQSLSWLEEWMQKRGRSLVA